MKFLVKFARELEMVVEAEDKDAVTYAFDAINNPEKEVESWNPNSWYIKSIKKTPYIYEPDAVVKYNQFREPGEEHAPSPDDIKAAIEALESPNTPYGLRAERALRLLKGSKT